MVKRKEPDKLDTILLNLQIVVSLLTELPEVIKLKERLAEQASHVKRLLRDNELLRAENEELRLPLEEQPADFAECDHDDGFRAKDEDGAFVWSCCGDDYYG